MQRHLAPVPLHAPQPPLRDGAGDGRPGIVPMDTVVSSAPGQHGDTRRAVARSPTPDQHAPPSHGQPRATVTVPPREVTHTLGDGSLHIRLPSAGACASLGAPEEGEIVDDPQPLHAHVTQQRGADRQSHSSTGAVAVLSADRDSSLDSHEPTSNSGTPRTRAPDHVTPVLRVLLLMNDFDAELDKGSIVTPRLSAYVTQVRQCTSRDVKSYLAAPDRKGAFDAIVTMTLLANGSTMSSTRWALDLDALVKAMEGSLRPGGILLLSIPPGTNSTQKDRREQRDYRTWLVRELRRMMNEGTTKCAFKLLDNGAMVDDQGFAYARSFKHDEVRRRQYTDVAQHVMTNPIRRELLRFLQPTADRRLADKETLRIADLRRVEDRRQRHERRERETRQAAQYEADERARRLRSESDEDDAPARSRDWRDERASNTSLH